MKKIILTGGGTAGHVTPNIALLDELKKANYEIAYIGSYQGIERDLIQKENIRYHGIATGKLRRYFDIKNFLDPFKVFIGFLQSIVLLKKYKPNIIFSKGGFVAVPVVYAAKLNGIPVISHESDMTPGLANKLTAGSTKVICYSFPETKKYLPKEKARLTGTPIRREILQGDAERARKSLGFDSKPVLLAIGGSLGSVVLNEAVREILPKLQESFNIIHICGKGNRETDADTSSYRQFEYVDKELRDYFALADIVVSRAGANVLAELLALKKPNVLIPLSQKASRGDQILNADSYEKQGFSKVVQEEALNAETLYNAVQTVYADRDMYIENMQQSGMTDGVSEIIKLIKEYTK